MCQNLRRANEAINLTSPDNPRKKCERGGGKNNILKALIPVIKILGNVSLCQTTS